MPAFTVPMIGLASGVFFAWAASEELSQRQGALQSSAVWIVALYSLLVHSPVAAYLFAVHPDWSTCYMVPPEYYYPGLLPALLLANLVMPLLGFLLAAEASSEQSALKVLRLGGTALTLCCVATLLFVPRLVVSASYNEFHHNFGIQSVAGSPLGYSLLLLVVLVSCASAWTYATLKRLGRKSGAGTRRTGWIR